MSFSFTTTKLHKGPNEIRPPSKESAFLKSQRFKRPKRRRGRKKKPKVDVLQTWTTYTYRKRPSCHDVCSKAGEFCVTIKMHPVKTYGCDKPRMFTAIKVIFEKNMFRSVKACVLESKLSGVFSIGPFHKRSQYSRSTLIGPD